MTYKQMLLSTLVVGFGLQALPAAAQSGDIIVTARKREESILKVPVAVTALSGEQLEKFGTNDLYSMSQRTPGLIIGTQTGSIGPQLSLRGIGTGVLNPAIDQAVSLNVDGVGMSQGLAFTAALFDSQSVQVLRGPQALFFGKNSTGGVIALETNDPGNDFETKVGLGYETESENKLGEFIISGPVSDTLGLRLAYQHSDREGPWENLATGNGTTGLTQDSTTFGAKESTVLRGTAKWTPTDNFDAKFKINYAKERRTNDGGQGQLASCPDGVINRANPAVVGATGAQQFLSPNDSCTLDKSFYIVNANPASPLYAGPVATVRNNGVPFYDLTQIFGSLELNYDLTPDLKLTSVSGVYTSDHNVMINGVQTGFAGPLIIADTDFQKNDKTQEIRLTSDFKDSPLNFMVGAYYQDSKLQNRTGLFFLGPRDKGLLTIDTKTWAGFGQVLYKITPQIELAAGARYVNEEKDFSPRNLTTGLLIPLLPGTNSLESNSTSPEVSITYTPTDDLTLFASYRKGFKSGGWDVVSNPAANANVRFDDEQIDGFEGGVKARFLDRALSVNVSAYKYDYDGLQTGANESTPAGFLIRTINAASAEIKGVDFDITYNPPQIEGLSLFANVNYNDATYGKFDNAPCWGGQTAAQGCNRDFNAGTGLFSAQDLSGKPLLKAPEWSGSVGLDYTHQMSNGMSIVFGTTTQWTDEFFNNTLERADFVQDGYTKTSASIGLKGADDAWDLTLIGNNIGDEITAGFCTNFNGQGGNFPGTVITGSPTNAVGVDGVDELVCQPDAPREIWLRFNFRPNVLFGRRD